MCFIFVGTKAKKYMSYGILKSHHGYMKAQAMREHLALFAICQQNGIDPVGPKRKHWHSWENASAIMLEMLADKSVSVPDWIRVSDLLYNLDEAKKEYPSVFAQ